MKRKGDFWAVLLAVFFIGFSVYMLYSDYYLERDTIKRAFSGEGFTDFNEVASATDEDVTEGHFSLSVDASFGCFGTISEGKDVKDYYYVAWLDDSSVVALDISRDKDAEVLDEIEKTTWDFVDGVSATLTSEPLLLNVEADSLSSESDNVENGYLEYLAKMGVTPENYQVRMTILKAETMGYYKFQKVAFFILCIVFLLIGALILISFVGDLIRKAKGIKDPVDISSGVDNRSFQVSFMRARSRISSKVVKKNLNKYRIEMVLAILVAAASFGVLYYSIINRDANNGLIKYIDEYSQLFIVIIVAGVIWFIGDIIKMIQFISNLRYFSDVDFERIEGELDRPSTRVYPQSLYLTDSFIVKLHSAKYHGATTANDVDTFFARYKDVEWVYASVIGMENTKYHDNIGATVYGRTIGKQVIIRFSSPDKNSAIVSDILGNIIKKNPDIREGYTEENKEYFKNLENDTEKVS